MMANYSPPPGLPSPGHGGLAPPNRSSLVARRWAGGLSRLRTAVHPGRPAAHRLLGIVSSRRRPLHFATPGYLAYASRKCLRAILTSDTTTSKGPPAAMISSACLAPGAGATSYSARSSTSATNRNTSGSSFTTKVSALANSAPRGHRVPSPHWIRDFRVRSGSDLTVANASACRRGPADPPPAGARPARPARPGLPPSFPICDTRVSCGFFELLWR